MIKEIIAYTDGSGCVAGELKGCGGFGTYFPSQEHFFKEAKAFSLGFMEGKTGEMETLALLYAIKALPITSSELYKLVVYSDSEYVCKTFTEDRLYKWKAKGWRNTSGEVKNKELWILVDQELMSRKYLSIELRHIRSHSLDKVKSPEERKKLLANAHIVGNAIADQLANYKRFENRLGNVFELKFFKHESEER